MKPLNLTISREILLTWIAGIIVFLGSCIYVFASEVEKLSALQSKHQELKLQFEIVQKDIREVRDIVMEIRGKLNK